MWKNKQIKQRALKTLKSNYFTIVALCFVLVFFGILSGYGSQLVSIHNTGNHEAVSIAEEKIMDESAPTYTPGVVTYLNDFFAGNENSQEIASQVLDGYKDRGGFIYNIMYKVDQLIFSYDAVAITISAIAIAVYLAYFFLLKNVLLVGFARFLTETRTYSKTSFKKVFYVFRKGGVLHCAVVMLARTLFLALISILVSCPLIVGAVFFILTENFIPLFIGLGLTLLLIIWYASQYYGLFLVPYILSENPLMPIKAAFRLSKAMMRGNRIHAFGLDLSFVGWEILSFITIGLLNIFFVLPYKNLAKCEMYMMLRKNAIITNMENSSYLNDKYLTNPPMWLLEENNIIPTKDMFIFPVSYPRTAPAKQGRIMLHLQEMDPMRHYKVLHLILFFFIFAFIGWCWEVGLHLIRDGVFINRGTLFGPWLPIYGCGGVMIIVFLKKLAKKPALLFLSTIALCCIMEYSTSWYLETFKGMKYWDYSNYFFNINGRICLEGALVFALGGLIFVYIAGPALDNMLSKIKNLPKIIVTIVLLALFTTDMVYSHFNPNQGKGITYNGGFDQPNNQTSISQNQKKNAAYNI